MARADEAANLVRFRKTAIHMGVEFEVELFAGDESQAEKALAAGFARIASLDRTMSDYDPASELSRLSETSTVPPGTASHEPPATARPIPLSDDLWRVLAFAQNISRQNDGAFDVTIGPLTKLWRRARRQKELPADQRLAEARMAVGYRFLKLDDQARTAQLLRPNMRLDLGGIAKGFAADEALAEIRKQGVARALVRASGDIAVGDPPPGESGWRIGIAPLDPDEPPTRFVRLANRAISTSGDARQHLVVDGRRYSHIIDPRTGLGVVGRSSLSVIARTGMEADGVATAVSVLGAEKGLALAGKLIDVELLMVAEDASGKSSESATPGFQKYAETQPPK
ncbi:MAG: FAD:protein FMN transferase [Planctomycetaceae bacterium]|nr:FAD:protein FMN transferase [Planctomycetaceae bacterium]